MNLRIFNFLRLGVFLLGMMQSVYGNIPGQGVCQTQKHADPDKAEYTRTISREFQTTSDGTVALYNKYGKVDVRTWSENKVKVDVTILVVARDQSEADRTFNRINVNFMSSYGYVKAETMISNLTNGWSWDVLWGNDNRCAQDYKINYQVYMPPGNSIDLKNSYGDSYLASFSGKLNADIKYGDIKSADMSNDVDLILAYGDGNFRSMGDLRADLSYGKLNIEYAKNAQTDTKYSEFKLHNCADLRMKSMYDDLEIHSAKTMKIQTKYSELELGKIGNLYLTAQYTDTNVDYIAESLDADINYGDLVVASLGDRFQVVNFFGNYADLKLVPTSSSQSYSFDLQGNYGDLRYPRASLISTENTWNTGRKVSGKVNGGGGGKIVVKVNYGDVIISN
jgi:hypothetical protein